MVDFREDVVSIAAKTLVDVAGFVPGDYEIHHVLIDSSSLYQEIHILFSFELEKGIFQSNKQLREFKYDLVNKCGIMSQVLNKKETKSKIIKIFGDKTLIQEKAWI